MLVSRTANYRGDFPNCSGIRRTRVTLQLTVRPNGAYHQCRVKLWMPTRPLTGEGRANRSGNGGGRSSDIIYKHDGQHWKSERAALPWRPVIPAGVSPLELF